MSQREPLPLSPDAMAYEIRSLLEGFPRDLYGNLKSARLRQLERIGLSMTASLDNLAFDTLKTELIEIRKKHETRLAAWRRAMGG